MSESIDNRFISYPSKNKPSVKVGDTFPNNNIPEWDVVKVVGYGGCKAVKVEFPDGRFGFGTVVALRAGTILPEES